MNSSPSIATLSAALVQAQAKMPAVKFDAENPFLHNKYATLGAVIETSRPILAEFGLAIIQMPISGINQIGIRSILLHESGEFVEDVYFLAVEGQKGVSLAQSSGAIITYLRRYAWAAILGLYADEDTDGNSEDTKQKEVVAEKGWTRKQLDVILDVLANIAPTDEEATNILDLSILPRSSTAKTVTSWAGYVKQVVNSGKGLFDAADVANQKYEEAKGGK